MSATAVAVTPYSPTLGQPLLDVRDLKVYFAQRKQLFAREIKSVRAVDGVSFDLKRGETLGLVGESGCGKSTTARAILRLVPVTSGSVRFDLSGGSTAPNWVDLTTISPAAMRDARRRLQIIFQDPYASLNPRITVGSIISEPMHIFRMYPQPEIARRTQSLMREVGLDPKFIKRYPHEFSGGQRQRIGIARALALDPAVIVCDEPVSALDVSIRSQVLNLLMELQAHRGLSYLFIAHDLSVVKRISHRVAVMYLGRIVELAGYDEIYRNPLHPYTAALLSAIPIPDPAVESKRQRVLLKGEVPSPAAERQGCAFAPRCPKVMDRCRVEAPTLQANEQGHLVSCHLYDIAPPRSA